MYDTRVKTDIKGCQEFYESELIGAILDLEHKILLIFQYCKVCPVNPLAGLKNAQNPNFQTVPGINRFGDKPV